VTLDVGAKESLAREEFSLKNSVPAPSAVKATSAKYKQDDEDDQKCGGIHGRLLREIEPLSAA
jgi:hypothetical protein